MTERGEKWKKQGKLRGEQGGRWGREEEGGGRQCSERGRLSAAEYLTAEKQFDTLAPCYHPIMKIPHKVKHCDTSSTGYKHYITPHYITPIITATPFISGSQLRQVGAVL